MALWTAPRQSRRERRVAQPCDTPLERPTSFSTGRRTPKLTVRTAWSTAPDCVHGAIRDGVELVELRVDAVDRAADLADHRQHLTLCTADQRRKAPEDGRELEQRPAERETDRKQEEREQVPGGVP